jgi:hypothetical protein
LVIHRKEGEEEEEEEDKEDEGELTGEGAP